MSFCPGLSRTHCGSLGWTQICRDVPGYADLQRCAGITGIRHHFWGIHLFFSSISASGAGSALAYH